MDTPVRFAGEVVVPFEAVVQWVLFVACFVDDEKVTPQEGPFYGGWITSDLVGPFKGGPGTMGW